MPEIRPDLSDKSRCISVHWNLPVQCVLPSSHRENWHEAWHPSTGNRLRYRRSMGSFVSEDLHHGEWHDLQIPPPGGFCGLPRDDRPDVRCAERYGHGWVHRAIVDGVRHTWNTPPPKDLTVDQVTRDVEQLRGMVVEAHARIAELEADSETVVDLLAEVDRLRTELAKYVGHEPTIAEEMAYLSRCVHAVHDVCDAAEKQASRWEDPLPVPEWVAVVRKAVSGERPEDPTDRRRRIYIDGEGNAWMTAAAGLSGECIGKLAGIFPDDETVVSVRNRTGGLREIGRCW